MTRKQILLTLSAFLVGALFVSAMTAVAKTTFPKDTIYIAQAESKEDPLAFEVELARTPEQLRQGLMFRTYLGENSGMLFIFDPPTETGFWMRNTLIPLDIIFVDIEGRITKIHENAIPLDETSISSDGTVRGVLEIAGGRSQDLGIQVGDIIHHKSFGNDLHNE